MRIDVIFGLLPFEEEAVRRAQRTRIGDRDVCVCTPEDLILMKIVSTRPRDLDDARGILSRRLRELDLAYLEPRLHELADLLDRPEIDRRWEEWEAAPRARSRRGGTALVNARFAMRDAVA